MSHLFESAAEIATRLHGKRLIDAEFMYKPRPQELREQRVFDFTLASRLNTLSRCEDAAVVLICNHPTTSDSFAYLSGAYPRLTILTALANPTPFISPDPYSDTPTHCEWHDPAVWRRYTLTDRWARILFTLDFARNLNAPGYLIMPAHDSVWGKGLLRYLISLSERHARNGLPAAVSPYTSHQHSDVPSVDIPPEIIDALNAAFDRDSLLRWRLRFGRYQAFWGKMGMIPFGMCAEVRDRVETMVWEDDLEIDRVIREAGYGIGCRWIDNPALYRQAPPIFDRAGLRAVIERTLHYSLNIPGGKSLLNQPLDAIGRLRKRISPRIARAESLSEEIIAESSAEASRRLQHYGMSWVDWGAYRYGVRVGDPLVQVWKYEPNML
jgi:hypothetical protein